MQETLTGRGVWAQISESYVAVEMQKPSQGDSFLIFEHDHIQHHQLIAKLVCMYVKFQNPSPCEGFFKTPLPVRVSDC